MEFTKKPKANLYMLIKIEIDDDKFPNDDVQKYIAEFCKRNNALWIDYYYNDADVKLPISADYGQYWIEGENSEACKWEICDNYHLHYDN